MENKDSKKIFGDDSDDDTSEDSETWKVISLLWYNTGSPCEIIDIAWSPDAEYIVAACMDGGSRIWRVKEGQKPLKDTTKTCDDLSEHKCNSDNHTAVLANSESKIAAVNDISAA
ncbi:13991_t:CDS:2 [Racocetra fulgida]|uniref:13991_t:CDS:1 n=1 Tax=Racocetra fulgida TaxID=60492 RepID=A0A9N9GP25_9GLOM|nr:13991_t:CDS:2 [Racocetra fulgida]